ncbi:MAG: hypothetical protein RLZZ426_906 [Actinomycetota bacterium]|jgi:signal peptidase I
MSQTSSNDRTPVRSFRIYRLIAIGIVLAVVIRLLILQVYVVSSDSMAPTLSTDQRIAVWKPARVTGIQRGDLVVFDGINTFAPVSVTDEGLGSFLKQLIGIEHLDSRLFLKRVIAVGGDRLMCCDPSGQLVLNGQTLVEPYLADPTLASAITFDVIVPQGRVWLMGDNRANSRDSRELMGMPGGGFIDKFKIVGRVVFSVWPPERIGP